MIGQLLAGHYRVLQVLGAGGFGQTYITEDLHLPGYPKCVLKHLKPASADRALLDLARKLFEKEAIVLQQLGNHDRIPRLLAYFEENQEFYLVQEYIPGHPLSTELKNAAKWSEPQVIELLEEILEILTFIHAQGVIHRDLKPDNIMRRSVDRKLILIDFGAIKQVRNQQLLHGQNTMTVAIGTPGYMPIEQASGNPRASSDMYALGAIAIQALTGVNPYDLPADDRTGELKWEHLTVADPRLVAILQQMTRYHFKDRYHTATEALQAVRGLSTGTFTPHSTYIQTPPVTQPPHQRIDSAATVVAPGVTRYPPSGSPGTQPSPPARTSLLPIVGGIVAIGAAVGSFALFSNNLLDRRDFATDLQSDRCRIATPTDLPSTRVRAQPQRDAKIEANLPRGTKVVFLAAQDAFIQIQMADRSTGWVYNNQVTGCNVPLATPTATPKPPPKTSPRPSIVTPQPLPVPTPKNDRQPDPEPVTPQPSPEVVPSPSESPIPIDVPSPSPEVTPSPSPVPSVIIYPPPTDPLPEKSTPSTPTPAPPADRVPLW
ncbi:protein kinase [Chamaesiphon sp.]|uniref:protein kinase domain-containing protein n=1 Tax=Chamaesiphon sp. TaxID=2814140 RepID=UPI0035943FCC